MEGIGQSQELEICKKIENGVKHKAKVHNM